MIIKLAFRMKCGADTMEVGGRNAEIWFLF